MVRDARRRAPHHEGLADFIRTSEFSDLILRSIAKRCVSKDEATDVEIALIKGNIEAIIRM